MIYWLIRNSDKFDIIQGNSKSSIVWFGIPIILKSNNINYKNKVTSRLNKLGIDTRPLISGNFANQPAVKLYNLRVGNDLKNADFIDRNSFFIGLHNTITTKLTVSHIKKAFYTSL